MKKLNFLLIAFLAISISSLVFTSCEDDDADPKKPYVGVWESAIYPDINLSTGEVNGTQKMVFEFTNTSFIGTIYGGLADATTDAELQEMAAMKGTISATDSKMNVEINEVSAQGGPFTSKESDPETFATKFDATIGTLLEESFVVDYVIVDDVMTFSLPIKLPNGGSMVNSLNLTKQ